MDVLYVWPKAMQHGVFCRQEMMWLPRGPAIPPASATDAQEHPSTHVVAAGTIPPMGRTRAVAAGLVQEEPLLIPHPGTSL